jgi:hypothetical protein
VATEHVKVTKTIKFIEAMMEDPDSEQIGFSVFGNNQGKLGELVATPQRIIFGSKSFFGGEAFEDVYYKDIHSVDYKENFGEANLEIYFRDSARVLHFSSSDKVGLRGMRDIIYEYTKKSEDETETEPFDSNGESIVDQLKELAQLKEDGHISEEEYESLKNKLID